MFHRLTNNAVLEIRSLKTRYVINTYLGTYVFWQIRSVPSQTKPEKYSNTGIKTFATTSAEATGIFDRDCGKYYVAI